MFDDPEVGSTAIWLVRKSIHVQGVLGTDEAERVVCTTEHDIRPSGADTVPMASSSFKSKFGNRDT